MNCVEFSSVRLRRVHVRKIEMSWAEFTQSVESSSVKKWSDELDSIHFTSV